MTTRAKSLTSEIFEKYKYRRFISMVSNTEALERIFTKEKLNPTNKKEVADLQIYDKVIGKDGNIVTLNRLSEIFQSTTIKGKFINEIISNFADIDELDKFIKITYKTPDKFKNQYKSNVGNVNYNFLNNSGVIDIIFDKNSAPRQGNTETNRRTPIDQEILESYYTSINVGKDRNRSTPGLAAVQILDPNLRACLKQSQELSVFFNLINTIDMSMALPYINIKFLVPATFNSGITDQEEKYVVSTFSSFLYGENVNKTENNKAIDGDFYRSKYDISRYIDNDPDVSEPNKKITVTNERAVVDLGVFTSPQTLVNGEEKIYGDYNSFNEDDLKNRKNPIHDKFRPFMSIESINFDVRPTKELMNLKTAIINLILYDKSRLNEVLGFIKPELMGSFGGEILLEYGWQHTLGDKEYVSEEAMNPIAEFINSLKNYERYRIINNTYSIQENGQVNITLNISMVGPDEIRGTQFTGDFQAFTIEKNIYELIHKIRTSKIIGLESKNIFFELTNDQQNLLSTPTTKSLNDLITQIKKLKGEIAASQSEISGRILKEIDKVLHSIDTLKKEVENKQSDFKKKQLAGSFNFINSNEDPFLDCEFNNKNKFNDSKKYMSLGKVLLGLLGKILAATHKYDEIQLVFFNLNEKAIRARHLNIASIPIEKEDFMDYIFGELQKTNRISIEGMTGLILKRYVNEKAALVYGLREFYKLNDSSETEYNIDSKIANSTTSTVRENNIRNLEKGALTEIYKQYYGDPTNNNSIDDLDVTFKIPRIRMLFDTLTHQNSPNINILRINFYDENDNPYESMFNLLNNFQNKTFSNAISSINFLSQEYKNIQNGEDKKNVVEKQKKLLKFLQDKKILKFYKVTDTTRTQVDNLEDASIIKIDDISNNNFVNIKTAFKELLPSITFGMPNSAAISANVSSMNNSLQSTAFMTRNIQATNTKSDYKYIESLDKLPTRIMPSQISAKIIGCPMINFAQMIFFDFNTNTTIDNAYSVSGIKHTISAGKFETDLTLTLADGYANFIMNSTVIKKFINELNEVNNIDKKENTVYINESQARIDKTIQTQIELLKSKKLSLLFRFKFLDDNT